MKLSIVATLYHSELHLTDFYKRCSSIANKCVGNDYELILVNDGSPDSSLEIAIELHNQDDKVVVIDLSRNFGHHQAMMAGLSYAKGEQVFLIDSDLEEPPELLSTFMKEQQASSADVVFGVQKNRRDSGFSKLAGSIFYRAFRFLTDVQQPDHIITARLMSRRYLDALLLHKEYEINIGGLWVITGFSQQAIEVEKQQTSDTTYSFSNKLNHLINAITSFSSKPLVYTFYFGCIISFFSMLYVCWLVLSYFIFGSNVDGFTTIAVSLWMIGGIVISLMGVQGIYIAKIFSEVKQRPLTITKKIYSANQDNS